MSATRATAVLYLTLSVLTTAMAGEIIARAIMEGADR